MRMITQWDIQEILRDAKWSPEKLTSVVGGGLSLRDFVARPEVKEDEALFVSLNNTSIGVDSSVLIGILTGLVTRVVPVLEISHLKEVQDFHQEWVKNPPVIPGGREVSSGSIRVFGELQRVSNISCFKGDWVSFLATQVILQALKTPVSHKVVHSICVCGGSGWMDYRTKSAV